MHRQLKVVRRVEIDDRFVRRGVIHQFFVRWLQYNEYTHVGT